MLADVNGVQLAYSRSGVGALPLIYGHGLAWSRAYEDAVRFIDWQPVEDVAPLIRYDARGHGLSDGTEDEQAFTWEALSADMLSLADALGIGRFVAGGASMGAASALYAACAQPERVAGLVLVIPPTAWETRVAQASLHNKSADLIESEGISAWVRSLTLLPHQPQFIWGEHSEREATHLAYHRVLDARRLPWLVRGAALSDLPDRTLLRGLPLPCLILGWADDPGHPESTVEALVAALPHATAHVARDFAAFSGWGRLIAAFMGRVSGQAGRPDA